MSDINKLFNLGNDNNEPKKEAVNPGSAFTALLKELQEKAQQQAGGVNLENVTQEEARQAFYSAKGMTPEEYMMKGIDDDVASLQKMLAKSVMEGAKAHGKQYSPTLFTYALAGMVKDIYCQLMEIQLDDSRFENMLRGGSARGMAMTKMFESEGPADGLENVMGALAFIMLNLGQMTTELETHKALTKK